MAILNKYETIFVMNATLDEEALSALQQKFLDLIAANGGSVLGVDVWGKKHLAYEIDDMREGYYVLVNFEAPAAFIAELERVYRITDGIMRSIVVRK